MSESGSEKTRSRAKIAMVKEGYGTLPAIEEMQPWQLRVVADDDALAPVIARNNAVVVDCSERELVDGEIYAVRHGQAVRLWLYHHGFDGVGQWLGDTPIGTLSSLAGHFRCEAALDQREIQIVGRCVGLLDGDDQAIDPLVGLENERQALLDARARLIQVEGGRHIQQVVVPEAEGGSVEALRNWLQRSLKREKFLAHFTFQQKLDALNSRIMYIEDRMSRQTATSFAGIEAQLEMLWDVHYAPFPEELDDLGALTIASARRSLKRLCGGAPQTRQDDETNQPARSAAIKIVPSPRQSGRP